MVFHYFFNDFFAFIKIFYFLVILKTYFKVFYLYSTTCTMILPFTNDKK